MRPFLPPRSPAPASNRLATSSLPRQATKSPPLLETSGSSSRETSSPWDSAVLPNLQTSPFKRTTPLRMAWCADTLGAFLTKCPAPFSATFNSDRKTVLTNWCSRRTGVAIAAAPSPLALFFRGDDGDSSSSSVESESRGRRRRLRSTSSSLAHRFFRLRSAFRRCLLEREDSPLDPPTSTDEDVVLLTGRSFAAAPVSPCGAAPLQLPSLFSLPSRSQSEFMSPSALFAAVERPAPASTMAWRKPSM
mmetsp:Transcript_54407/g.115565  ORF Transcript_54407/g.115565 Transcript_54407/m.115565 type:complete len:248 (+) Transcript_54407:1962-2705(+)